MSFHIERVPSFIEHFVDQLWLINGTGIVGQVVFAVKQVDRCQCLGKVVELDIGFCVNQNQFFVPDNRHGSGIGGRDPYVMVTACARVP